MTPTRDGETPLQSPLRLWPGVLVVVLQWLLRFVLPAVVPEGLVVALFSGLAGGLLVLVWWAFFSQAPRMERFGGALLLIAAVVATPVILDKSVATAMMGFMFPVYAIPVLSLAFVAWAVLSRNLSAGLRRASMAATVLLVCGGFALLRTGGITGTGASDFAWRWSKTPEERLVAQASLPPAATQPVPAPASPPEAVPETQAAARPAAAPETSAPVPAAPAAVPTSPEPDAGWPGFRGSGRDSIVSGPRIGTDWTAAKPVELWRRPVGPGWSSFAVHGDRLYTQEQRGEEEVVTCYNAATGNPIWAHRDPARFWESNAGAGPRGTPTLHGGRVYTFGATGILNALDAAGGAVIWSHNVSSDTGTKVPMWGFSSSPLVVDGLVLVAASGRLAAYDAATGAHRWTGPAGGTSYSSPHYVTAGGAPQVLLTSSGGTVSLAPADGTVLWKYAWPSDIPIVQPAITPEGELLISGGDGAGIRRVGVAHGTGGWTVEERWASMGLKPYFNDFVVHNGHAFGFDGFILSCIDLKDGKRKWKGGRYGNGQLLLLRDQDLLFVISEDGDLALVRADPGKYTELARLPALEGKTWNHPVLAGDRLFVRNGAEMAAFRLPLSSR